MKNVSPHAISGAPLSFEATWTSTPGYVSAICLRIASSLMPLILEDDAKNRSRG
jgi:hypothetical protein